jgi:hypothetical protein
MDLHPGFQYLPALLVQALLLMLLSRLLFRSMVAAFADRRGGGLITVLRGPGNFLHETGHALGYLIFGYRIAHIVPCLWDPRKSGVCVRGKQWSPIAFPWLADGAAALMPLVVGSVTLVVVGWALGITDHRTEQLGTDMGMFPAAADQFVLLLKSLDWHRWQTYVFLYAALTIGAEISPSTTDLHYAIPAVVSIAFSLAATVWVSQHASGPRNLLIVCADRLLPVVQKLSAIWGLAIILLMATAAVTLPFTFLIYSLRPPKR